MMMVMRLKGTGILGKVRATLIFAVCSYAAYTVWATYKAHLSGTAILETSICIKDGNNCIRKYIRKDAAFMATPLTVDKSQAMVNLIDSYTALLSNNCSNISVAYQNKWVGLSNISGLHCKSALYGTVEKKVFSSQVKRIYPKQFIADSRDCRTFIETYGYGRYPAVSREELEFPIAFIILFHKDLDQVLFLLRALYRPHNVYCLTVDTKVSVEFLEAVKSVTRCLPNVFVASQLENIVYAGFSRLMADIHCMADLLKHPVQWKYVINMPGQQFPLRTNLEIVRILRKYNGANDVEGNTGVKLVSERFEFKHIHLEEDSAGFVEVVPTAERKEPPPHNLTIVKGSAYGTLSRAFIHFVLHNQVAKDFLDWCKEIYSPDEYFWATLHHSKNISVPGGYTGKPDLKPWLTSYAAWGYDTPCTSIHVHSICILVLGDLAHLMERHELTANKFYITHDPGALHCLDEMLFNLTFTKSTRNLTFYDSLAFALPVQ